MAEHNELIDLGKAQADPYHATGADFPVSQSQSGPHGMAEGSNQLVPDGGYLDSPRCNEDSGMGKGGYGTPSEWGDGGKSFPTQRNKGESSDSATTPAFSLSVDRVTGDIVGSGYKQTKVGEVPDPNVHIG